MAPVLKELSNQTAVSVTLLEMQLMPFIGPHLVNAYVSTSMIHNHVVRRSMNNYNNLA